MSKYKCPTCEGEKKLVCFVDSLVKGERGYAELRACFRCKGSGVVSKETIDAIEDGKKIRLERLKGKYTMCEFAKIKGISITELSALENGNIKK